MPIFVYEGISPSGKRSTGLIDADSSRHARQKLRAQGITALRIDTQDAGKSSTDTGTSSGRVKAKELTAFTRQLATLIGAGIPIVDSLAAILDQGMEGHFQEIIASVREDVKGGRSLNGALEKYQKIFSPIFINMIRAGEESGTLEIMLDRIADFQEKSQETRRKVLGSLFYPIILMCVGILMVLFLLTVVMPRITSIFEGLKATLPLPTRILLAVSGTLRNHALIFLGATIFLILAGIRLAKTQKRQLDEILLKIPRVGPLITSDQVARFARTMSVLLKGGVSLQRALEIAETVVTNQILKEAVSRARELVRNGESLGGSLRQSPYFPRLAVAMIQTGERSGQLEELLLKTAQGYESEVGQIVATITSIVEPVMILLIGSMVLFMVLSVLLPIFEMSQAVQ
ncbi:type II secretion system F family protein [Leptospirillum ferrooxidans]|jgi:general secretion pathway protein F|uniref:General secretion pathway protein F n=1 Tax=Leptospirillum ferrooxidans (strain C2-3) TaxID=1162668 RepID=I0IQ03_LEPFC|nr:type II secretion system F family protein [Leptospirillum ferrooxidans]BAM07352.1 putative general secretion pathway protein F [Leptospirillum ferrooxidans C2-3]